MPGNELQTQLEEKVDVLVVELRALTDQLTTNETISEDEKLQIQQRIETLKKIKTDVYGLQMFVYGLLNIISMIFNKVLAMSQAVLALSGDPPPTTLLVPLFLAIFFTIGGPIILYCILSYWWNTRNAQN